MNALDVIDQELERAAEAAARSAARGKGQKRPVFLFLSEGHSALIRPTHNLPECVVMLKHNKYHENQDLRVNAICAKEIGKPCKYCAKAEAEGDKALSASPTFFVPIYVYGVRDKVGNPVTFNKKDEHGTITGTEPIKGFRVLELTSFGSLGGILKTLRNYVKDADYQNSITGNDFTISQVGAGKGKMFTVVPKPAKVMHPQIKLQMPGLDAVRTLVLEACPPVIAPNGSVGDASTDEMIVDRVAVEEGADNDIPEF